ncbi:cold shock domain-containing protein [Nocardia sp. PE-7]|uniref:cold-shock protein n=1 Tax=Nocardia sp. PE-7 TaxID=3058426 RepID=UPI002658492B|nr:cold shock domain-containing protein [Nocardia sp. PE-7]WKG11719.1 cold shock domain-containing protein [Nocardia sp. PE-7]
MPTMTTPHCWPTDPLTTDSTPDPVHRGDPAPTWIPGRVDWFDTQKGFGFLHPDDAGQPVFCDYTAIETPGYKTLYPGQRVVFTTTDTGRGPEAIRVLTYDQTTPAAEAAGRPRSRIRCRRHAA